MPDPKPLRRPAPFRPQFTLVLLYVAGFFLLYAMLIVLPEMFEAARELGPGPEELTPEEAERARQVSRQAISGGRVWTALVAAVLTVALGIWRRALPGLR